MSKFGGKTPTSHRVPGPASDLIELDEGKAYAIQLHPPYRGHKSLASVDAVDEFLSMPMVPGLVDLVHYDTAEGIFVYATGDEVWSVS
ncbi:MAG: hypothetical protein JRJ84_15450, partial [Deltaproteobacteria bacterium]|nr:hypothetical protein [Deltaproteobacteria bacterium]